VLSKTKLLTCTAATCFLALGNAQANELAVTHSVYLGGLFMGKLDTALTQSKSSYVITTAASTNKSLDWMFSWAASGRTVGNIDALKVSPVQHTHKSAWDEKKRGAEINYTDDGKVTFETFGKKSNNPNKYTPIEPGSLIGSMDPMSMFVTAALKLETTDSCSGAYPVFDGRRRYNVILSDAGFKELKKSSYSVFTGTAQGCKIDIEPLGGFKRKADFDLKDYPDIVMWVGSPVVGGRKVPVRLQVTTGFGSLELHLERYNLNDVRLASQNAR
jgi:Protein of unknown function (DUF3108)